jgi:NADPH-dependent 2,4-dienoyl-CoA reductase/sulfur reductase-like enzyme
MRTEVEEIDLAAGRVTAHDLAAGRSYREGFDSLVITTGAVPARPPLPGVDADSVFGVQTLDDGATLLADLDHAQPRRAVVVGGGYIGVEMAEALVRHGLAVTVVDHAEQPMTTLDPDMGRRCTGSWRASASMCAPTPPSSDSRPAATAGSVRW